MAENFLSDLSQDIGQLFSAGDNYDLIIQVGEGQNMKEFFAHSLILSARSIVKRMGEKKENGIITFKKPNISPEIIELILTKWCTNVIKTFIGLNLQKLSDHI